jgi:hypothetical protein
MEDSRFEVAAIWDLNAERGSQLQAEFPQLRKPPLPLE